MKIPTRRVAKSKIVINDVILRKIISGAQQGVDIAALKAAKTMSLKTGGYMPKGFVTLGGNKPGYSFIYGCKDCCYNYKDRTWKNVASADATIRLATDFASKGEVCTLNAIRHYQKPSLDLYLESDWLLSENEVAYWIVSGEYRTLNIAGNADVELEERVEKFLINVFKIILYK